MTSPETLAFSTCAQRLAASEVREGEGPIEFSKVSCAQRLAASEVRAVGGLTMREPPKFCAQRLAASEVQAVDTFPLAQFVSVCVFNALRHQRFER